jgi:lipoprotein signal peptidase
MIYMNNLKSYKPIIRFYELYYILALVFLDFLSKYLFILFLGAWKINLLWEYLFLKIFKNNWIAFSIELPYLKFFTLLIISWIIYYYFKYEKFKNNKYINLSFILIIAWAIWNWWERIFLWEVTDFIWVKYFSIFNFADIYINIWIIIYLSIIVLKKDKEWL